MQITIRKQEKNELEMEIDNITIAEILRVRLAENPNISFVAWRREHPTKNPIMLIKTKDKEVSKIVKEEIAKLDKELAGLDTKFSKTK